MTTPNVITIIASGIIGIKTEGSVTLSILYILLNKINFRMDT